MRRMLFAVLVSAAAVAIMPASSLASGHDRGEHHGEHHRRDRNREHLRHHRGHHGVRHMRIGHDPINENHGTAGTVKSFTGGVLTITLNDGSDVSGTVNDFTRINCEAPDGMEITTNDRGPGARRPGRPWRPR